MPLSFLNPALLFGAAAAALPVIIHFLSRRRVRRLAFSDLRFLDEVQARQARSLGVRRWLLLLLRVLAVLCVVLAAAGPRWGGLAGGAGARSLLFVIDTSASMNTAGDGGTRLDEARTVCADMIRTLPGDASVQVITGGALAEPLFGDWLPAGAGAAQGLAAVTGGEGSFDLSAVLREAARAAARAPGSPVDIVLLSDLQEAGVDDAVREAAAALTDARGVRFLLRRVGSETAGGGVHAVALPRRAVRPGENLVIGAGVVTDRADQAFALELDGRQVAEAVATAPPGEPQRIEFALTAPGPGRHRGVVRKESDAFAGDDQRPFVLDVPAVVDVLLLHGADRPGDGAGGRGGWRFLAQALQPGGGPSTFRVTALEADAATTGALLRSDVVVLVDVEPLGRTVLSGLAAHVREGGALLVLAGDPAQAAYLDGTLLPALEMEATSGFRSSAAAPARARVIDRAHPVFAGLDDKALGTLGDVAWRRWFALAGDSGRTLLSLTTDDPLLVVRDTGAGVAAVLAADLAPAAGDLAGSPMALPFFQRLTAWLARPDGGLAVNLEVGDEAAVRPSPSLPAASLEDAAGLVAHGPRPQDVRTAELRWRGEVPLLRAGPVRHAGFVTFTAGADTAGLVAAAVPADETLRPFVGPEGWRGILAALDLPAVRDLSGADPAGLAEQLRGRDLSPWLLAAAVALLLAELRLGRGAGAAPAAGAAA